MTRHFLVTSESKTNLFDYYDENYANLQTPMPLSESPPPTFVQALPVMGGRSGIRPHGTHPGRACAQPHPHHHHHHHHHHLRVEHAPSLTLTTATTISELSACPASPSPPPPSRALTQPHQVKLTPSLTTTTSKTSCTRPPIEFSTVQRRQPYNGHLQARPVAVRDLLG